MGFSDRIKIMLIGDSKSAEKSLGKVTKGIKKLGVAYLGLKGVKAGFELAASASRIEDATRVFKASGENINDLRNAVDGMISDATLIKQSNLAKMFGINSKAFGKFSEIAIAASKATGQSMEHMLQSIVTGTARQSRLILDNLGITLSLSKAYKTYGDSIGKSARELSEAEKQQAVMNTVMREGQKTIDKVAGAGATASDQYEKFYAQLENIKQLVGTLLIPLFTTLIKPMGAVVKLLRLITGEDMQTTNQSIESQMAPVIADMQRYQKELDAAKKHVDAGFDRLWDSKEGTKNYVIAVNQIATYGKEVTRLEGKLKGLRAARQKLRGGFDRVTNVDPVGTGEKNKLTAKELAELAKKRAAWLKKLHETQLKVVQSVSGLTGAWGPLGSMFVGAAGAWAEIAVSAEQTQAAVAATAKHFKETPSVRTYNDTYDFIRDPRRQVSQEEFESILGASPGFDRKRRAAQNKENKIAAGMQLASGGGIGDIASMAGPGGAIAGGVLDAAIGAIVGPLKKIADSLIPEAAKEMGSSMLAGAAAAASLMAAFLPLGIAFGVLTLGLGPLVLLVGGALTGAFVDLIGKSKAFGKAQDKMDKVFVKIQEAFEPFAEMIVEGTFVFPVLFAALQNFGILIIHIAGIIDASIKLLTGGNEGMTDKQLREMDLGRRRLENLNIGTILSEGDGRVGKGAQNSRARTNAKLARAKAKETKAALDAADALNGMNEELDNVPNGIKKLMRFRQFQVQDPEVGDNGTRREQFVRNGIGARGEGRRSVRNPV